jgi:hypothetical protein
MFNHTKDYEQKTSHILFILSLGKVIFYLLMILRTEKCRKIFEKQ